MTADPEPVEPPGDEPPPDPRPGAEEPADTGSDEEERDELRFLASLPPEMAALLPDGALADVGRPFVLAANSVVNTGPVWGDQRLDNDGRGPEDERTARPRVDSREGPVSPGEIFDAKAGFVEPDCFPDALAELDTGLLFLIGEPDTGRRTTALNLLERHSNSLDLRSVDSDRDLTTWKPSHKGTRGYLVDEPVLVGSLRRGDIDRLRRTLGDADARMVVVLADTPELRRHCVRTLRMPFVHHVTPSPRLIFEAHLRDAVPGRAARDQLLSVLDGGLLDELLGPGTLPAHVVELVAAVVEGTTDPDTLRERLSFLAREEVPALLAELKHDPDALSFLLAASVFEGLDHRVVMQESERLLALADGRLDAVTEGEAARQGTRPNPDFVFRRSLTEQLRAIGANPRPPEIRSAVGYRYTSEPVVFTRHRRGEAVLRHVWHEYGSLSTLLTEWLAKIEPRPELTAPVGRIMGLATRWGGGHQALRHLRDLALSERRTTRSIAAYALGLAAQDPVLTGEVKHRLVSWSVAADWRLRSTVALACATDFGLSRPDQALTLLAHLPRPQDAEQGVPISSGIREALLSLFDGGHESMVVRELFTWLAGEDLRTALALDTFDQVLRHRTHWFARELLGPDGNRDRLIGLVRRMLDDDERFAGTSVAVVRLCGRATWQASLRPAVEILLSALAAEMTHGALRLFVQIRQNQERDLFGKDIAERALAAWRTGQARPQGADHTTGRTV
ncbi:hypothetical protein [Streptomyces avicenniae]|uniref:hypothetical protein n=1 Tax=Streptomyces avicenniae TaxID=500153 RepID=UPI00069B97E9|nr:hypothetical protein [Streptomyces avicenniae]